MIISSGIVISIYIYRLKICQMTIEKEKAAKLRTRRHHLMDEYHPEKIVLSPFPDRITLCICSKDGAKKATYIPAIPASCNEKDKSDAKIDPSTGGTDATSFQNTAAISVLFSRILRFSSAANVSYF
jgi:hypothetical protein